MKEILQKPLIIIIVTIIALFFLISLRKTASKSIVSQKNIELLEQKLQDINNQVINEEKALNIASSEFEKEKIIRDELLLQKPGEYILQIPLETNTYSINNNSNQETPLEAWKKLFTNEK